MDKTTVAIDAPNGMTKVFTGDTAIVFTLSGIEDFLNKKIPQINANSAYVGDPIPVMIFADVISSLVGSFIEECWKANPTIASFYTNKVATGLMERSQMIIDACSREQLEAELSKIKESLDNIKRMAAQRGRGSDGRE